MSQTPSSTEPSLSISITSSTVSPAKTSSTSPSSTGDSGSSPGLPVKQPFTPAKSSPTKTTGPSRGVSPSTAGESKQERKKEAKEESEATMKKEDKKRKVVEETSDSEEDVTPIRKAAKKVPPKPSSIKDMVHEPPFPGCDPDVPLTQRERAQFMIELSRWGIAAGFGTGVQETLLESMISVVDNET
eukprot:GHVN01096352.1.p1 GENE.GHVN01096352.1~~GHVN01096352.1.p1  ORF type:complete len:187 (+),score=43.16 GHVN01096352.1:70-630(+)